MHVVFVRPPGAGRGFESAELLDQAMALPGACVHVDAEGTEARRLGARTSGQVFLHDSQGRLVFSGGITPARGAVGENAGAESVVAWLSAPPVDGGPQVRAGEVRAEALMNGAPVFGCALFGPDEDRERDRRP